MWSPYLKTDGKWALIHLPHVLSAETKTGTWVEDQELMTSGEVVLLTMSNGKTFEVLRPDKQRPPTQEEIDNDPALRLWSASLNAMAGQQEKHARIGRLYLPGPPGQQ